jgi:hypothetical protein
MDDRARRKIESNRCIHLGSTNGAIIDTARLSYIERATA